MNELDRRIAGLSPEKLALLLARLKELPAAAPAPVAAAIQPRRRAAGERPLSFAQERLWFVDQLAPGGSDYNVLGALRLSGAVDRAAFARTVAELLRRHEVLRAGFHDVDGRPVQTVVAAPVWAPLEIDLCALPAAVREAEARRLAQAEAGRPFDLGRPPLLRVTWLDLAAAEQLVLISLHHIVCDGWSLGVLAGELGEIYGAFAAGLPSPLAEPPAQYADYAEWQRAQLAGPRLAAELCWWRRQLAGATATVALRGAAAAGTAARGAGEVPFALPVATVEGLRAVGRAAGATPFMTFAALAAALFYAEGGQEDLCLGANAAHRGDLTREALVGFFVNQLVLRVRVDPAASFGALVGAVRAVTEEAHAHQELPFERLVEELAPERGAGQAPLFAVKVEWKDGGPPLRWPGLDVSAFEVAAMPLRCDLLLTAASVAGGIAGSLGYDRSRCAAEMVRQMAARLERIARLAAAEPAAAVGELARVSREEAAAERAVARVRLDSTAAAALAGARRRAVRL